MVQKEGNKRFSSSRFVWLLALIKLFIFLFLFIIIFVVFITLKFFSTIRVYFAIKRVFSCIPFSSYFVLTSVLLSSF